MIVLDLVRALAIALVLGRHLPPLDRALPQFLQPVARGWINFGWVGVDLFFVLSGFLVSGLLFQEYQRDRKIRVGRFLIRRGFKIYPSFYLFIAVVLWIQWSNGNYQQASISRILPELLFFQNYSRGLMDHTWSLAVEEHFYLLLPIGLLGLIAWSRIGKNPFRRLPMFCAAVALLCLGLRIITWYLGGTNFLEPTHLRVDSLLCGVLLSYYYHLHPAQTLDFARRYRWPLVAAGILLLLPIYLHRPSYPLVRTLGFSFTYVAFALLLLASLPLQFPSRGVASIPFRVIAFCGTYSYGIYLWHMAVKDWGTMYLNRWFGWNFTNQQELLVYLVGSILVGIALSMIIEVPFLTLRDKWFPSRSGAVEPSTSAVAPSPHLSVSGSLSRYPGRGLG
jgi:peptidoglycan/LPS O-acetylase OafA/YrhL